MKGTMKIAVATAASLALIAVPAAAKPATVHHDTSVTIEDYRYNPGKDKVTFYGHIDCADSCLADRKVRLKQTTDGIKAGTDMTNSKGKWSISFKGSKVPAGDFKAFASKRTIVKRHHGHVVKKTVCDPGKSSKFAVN